MKKILSLGIASAVLAMTALSASAGVVVRTDDKVTAGATITVSFVADADGDAVSIRTAATGATLVDAKGGSVSGLVAVSDDKTSVAIVGSSFKSGDVLFTQTYTVTAKEGEMVSVNVTDLQGTTGVATNLSATVESATTSSSSDSSSSDSSSTDSSSTDSSSTDSSSSDSGSSKPDGDKPAETGVALAIFPAIVAGAAVVVAKKRK